MNHCPICGASLVSDSCTQAACIQIEMRVEQAEREQSLVSA